MFTLTIQELISSKPAFDRLAALDGVKPAIKLRMVPIVRSVKQHLEDANAARLDLFKHFGTPSETAPGDYEVKPDAPIEAKRAVRDGWQSILEESIQIPGKKIPFEVIAEATYVTPMAGRVGLTAEDLCLLEWVVELPAEEAAEAIPSEKAKAATV